MSDLPELRTVDLDGPVAYREWPGPADGPTFVCVHGLGGTHLNWMSVAPGLARHGRVLALDLVGFGQTPRDGRSAGIPANRRILSRFIQEVTRPPVVAIGNSMGGGIVAFQAAMEPRSVEAIVLTSPALPWNRKARPERLIVAGFTFYRLPVLSEWAIRSRTQRMGPERLVNEALAICCVDAERIDPAVVRALVEGTREREDDADSIPAFLEAARSLMHLKGRPRFVKAVIERIECPTLVVHGTRDRLVPIELAREIARGRHGWRLEEFDDVGHVAMLEAPERWLAAVDDWLERLDLAAPRTLEPSASA